MKRTSFLLTAMVMAAMLEAQTKTPEAMLGAALHQEEAQGDINGAIAAYQKLLANRGLDRKIAAEALYHLGLCYQKLGDRKARQAYERLVSDYGDTSWASQARTRLAALPNGQPGRQTATVVGSGSEIDPSGNISPDGRYLVFPDWKTGNLGVRDFQTGKDRDLTTDGTWKGEDEFAEDSAISRDGKQVAYAWYQHRTNHFELRVLNFTGEPKPRKLFESAEMRYLSPEDWSPDGKWIAVSLEPENSDATTGQSVRFGMKAELGLVGAQDGTLRVIRTTDWTGPDTGFSQIQFSPDGKYLAYNRPPISGSRQRSTFVLDLGANREIEIATGHTQFMAWSADGKYLIFTSSRTGSNGLWTVGFANGAPQGDPVLIKPNVGQIASVGLSAGGALYYYTPAVRDLNRLEIATVDRETMTPGSPVELSSDDDEAEDSISPNWSPDGKSLAYISTRALGGGRERSIKIRTIATGETREVRPQGHSFFYVVRWAPDGGSLLIYAPEGVYRVDARSGEASVLMKQGEVPGPQAWALSPDQKTLYYRRDQPGKNAAFVARDLASGNEREIISRPRLGGVGLTPDGRNIFTASIGSDHARSFIVIPLNGDAPRDLIRVVGEPEALAQKHFSGWLNGLTEPNNRSTFVRKRLSDDGQDVEVWEVFADGSPARKLGSKLDPRIAAGGFTISPDGRQIAFVISPSRQEEKAPAQIVMLENFLPTAKTATVR